MAQGGASKDVAVGDGEPISTEWKDDTYRIHAELVSKRRMATRLKNKASPLLLNPPATLDTFRSAERMQKSIRENLTLMSDAFVKFTSAPAVLKDRQRIDKEFEKHEDYEYDASETIDDLQLIMDRIADELGLPQSSHSAAQDDSQFLRVPQDAPSIASADDRVLTATIDIGRTPTNQAEGQQSIPQSTPGTQEDQSAQQQYVSDCYAGCFPQFDPTPKIPKFNGDPTKYKEWWHLFNYYVETQPIDLTEKCRIFKSTLAGRAARAVSCIQISAEFYDLMKETIHSRFGNSNHAQASHVHRIHNLCRSPHLDRDDKFTDFATQLSQNVHALVALGNSFATLSVSLTPVILRCLPDQYRKRFNQIWRKAQFDEGNQLEVLISFLDEQASIIEESEQQVRFSENNKRAHGKNGRDHKNTTDPQSKSSKNSESQKNPYSFAGHCPETTCIFCSKNHFSSKCQKKLSPEERRKIVAENSACLRCLRKNHTSKKCRAKVSNCENCGGRHDKLVCVKKEDDQHSNSEPPSTVANCLSHTKQGTTTTLLQTGYVWAASGSRKMICRVILDPGSQRSFVSEKVAKYLKLKPSKSISINICGIAARASGDQQMNVLDLKLKSRFSEKQINISCLAMPKILGGVLPSVAAPCGLRPLADAKEKDFPNEIDLLIGADALHLVYDGMYRKVGALTASPTIFGWFLWGSESSNVFCSSVVTSLGVVQQVYREPKSQSDHHLEKSKENLESLRFLWDSEFLGIESSKPDEEKTSLLETEKFFKESIKISPDGRYIVTLPFRENIEALGQNQKLAYSRLISLLNNLKKKPKVLKAVDDEISRIIESGYAEPARPRSESERAHYLPILAVAKKSLGNDQEVKVRLVKDGGARSRDEASLNDVLETGPNYLPDIIAVLLQFRRRPIAIVADIRAAFNQFLINEKQRTFLRFYWPTGISSNPSAPIIEYWATVLDFGLSCSPYLHCAGIRHHLDLQMIKRPSQKDLLKELRDTFFMDDMATGAHSVSEAKSVIDTMLSVFRDGHFPLGRWATNDQEVASFIERAATADNPVITCNVPNAKFLGVSWNQVSDSLFVDVRDVMTYLTDGVPTKRKLLIGLSRIFDPQGFIAPITINFKILTQILWSRKIEWDSPLSGELAESFQTAAANLQYAQSVEVPRKLFSFPPDRAKRELHVFTDASLKAYGCVAYIREVPINDKKAKAAVSFVMSKARVTPLKGKWTVPRLELVSAVLAARLAKHIAEKLDEKLEEVFFYCDNSAVLGWLRDSPERWRPFVGNRIREIQGISKPESWRYVRSEDNSSDIPSRGLPLDNAQLRKFWLKGPSWLEACENPPPHGLNLAPSTQDLSSERKASIVSTAVVTADPNSLLIHKQFSSWEKAVRITAYVLRFISSSRRSNAHASVIVRTEEFEQAEQRLIRNIQKSYFGSDVTASHSALPKSHPLFKLRAFMNDQGFICCKSRLEKSSNISTEVKYPIILPGDEHLVQLLVRSIHARNCMHSGGVAAILHHLRERYFVIGARRTANKAASGCKVCVRFRAQAASEPVPPMPAFRIENSPPFSITGVDHCGPIYIKSSHKERIKSYCLLFVCAITRAVRLELVADLTTYEFLLALRRFISRNPAVKKIISDNSRTFTRAQKELSTLFDNAQNVELQNLLTERRIEWSYSTPKAPWHGGFWERLVSVIKRPIRKALGSHALNFREMETLLFEVERMVNDRPISAVIVDPNEPRALSPSCLLYGYASQPALPDINELKKSVESAKAIVFSQRWKRQQAALRSYWKQFQNDYLQYLRSLHYSDPQKSRSLRPGDVCLMHSEDSSRAYWPLCVVTKVFGGERTDSRKRSCEVKTVGGKIFQRPIQLLYPLEVDRF